MNKRRAQNKLGHIRAGKSLPSRCACGGFPFPIHDIQCGGKWFILCNRCGKRSPWHSKAAAINDWNQMQVQP